MWWAIPQRAGLAAGEQLRRLEVATMSDEVASVSAECEALRAGKKKPRGGAVAGGDLASILSASWRQDNRGGRRRGGAGGGKGREHGKGGKHEGERAEEGAVRRSHARRVIRYFCPQSSGCEWWRKTAGAVAVASTQLQSWRCVAGTSKLTKHV